MKTATAPDPPVRVLAEDRVLVDWGPMTLTIAVWDGGQARPVMAAHAARTALSCLETLADFQGFLRKPVHRLPPNPALPATATVVCRAFRAARIISDELTPLAAVAGAVADQVATTAREMGADRVIVNNGGDIALGLGPDETVGVGLRPPDRHRAIGRLTVRGDTGIGGVASSGWGGRSHSTGTADLVTVWAATAAQADAAATLIAGKTVPDGPGVARARTRDIDPLSDLGDRSVTVSVGPLTGDQKRQALYRASAAAHRLFADGRIRGCGVWIQGDGVILDPEGLLTLSPAVPVPPSP